MALTDLKVRTAKPMDKHTRLSELHFLRAYRRDYPENP